MDTFELKPEHLKLLQRAYVNWQYAETGAPAIDPKRPYGNSNVALDVAEILGWSVPDEDALSPSDYDQQYDALWERAMAVHRETQQALQILLQVPNAQPGLYRRAQEYDQRSWQLVE